MKKLMSLAVVCTLLAMVATASAGDRFDEVVLSPGPSVFGSSLFFGQPPPAPVPAGEEAKLVPAPGPVVPLYECVRYKDLHEMHPCAVPKVVSVRAPSCGDRCSRHRRRTCRCGRPVACSCCQPKCVNVKICVPPCGCERVKVSRDGRRVRYDYGKYAVDIRVKRGYIEVDYQD